VYAPIVVFGYNRPEHLSKTLRAIEDNPIAAASDVYIFLDGPKLGDENNTSVKECFEVAILNYRFGSTTVTSRPSNLGLAKSIRTGLDSIFDKFDRVIVIEDDIILAHHALKFLNEGLTHYQSNQNISCIHSYQYPVAEKLSGCVTLRGADCWGWATWRDRWTSTSFDSLSLRNQLLSQKLVQDFDLDGAMDYFSMLENQILGKVDSWAICWHASMFLQNRVCVYPPESLSKNIGSDGSGVHSGNKDIFKTEISGRSEWDFPAFHGESIEFREQMKRFYFTNKPKRTLLVKLVNRITDYFTN